MKKTLAAVATALAIGTFATPSAFAAPETYVIDGSHTYPRFQYNHLGYSMQAHRFTKTSGTITWDRAAKTAAVDITIDARSVDTGHALFNEHIQGEDFFHTAKYPTITFKSSSVTFENGKPMTVDGELTIKGITRPVTLAIGTFQAMPHPMLKKNAIGANATTTIKRSEFNAGKNAPFVSDEVTLYIPVEAIQQ